MKDIIDLRKKQQQKEVELKRKNWAEEATLMEKVIGKTIAENCHNIISVTTQGYDSENNRPSIDIYGGSLYLLLVKLFPSYNITDINPQVLTYNCIVKE